MVRSSLSAWRRPVALADYVVGTKLFSYWWRSLVCQYKMTSSLVPFVPSFVLETTHSSSMLGDERSGMSASDNNEGKWWKKIILNFHQQFKKHIYIFMFPELYLHTSVENIMENNNLYKKVVSLKFIWNLCNYDNWIFSYYIFTFVEKQNIISWEVFILTLMILKFFLSWLKNINRECGVHHLYFILKIKLLLHRYENADFRIEYLLLSFRLASSISVSTRDLAVRILLHWPCVSIEIDYFITKESKQDFS